MSERNAIPLPGEPRVVFLVGPAGSGKTQRCLTGIGRALAEERAGVPLLLLAPKQATFQLERQLLAQPGLGGYTRLQILSFERLALQVLEELEGPQRFLDEEGRRMVLRALLAEKQGELRLFRATARLPGFARQLSDCLRELQEERMQPEQLIALAGRCGDDGLAAKLHDLALLLGGYRVWIEEKALRDPYQLVSLAAHALREARRERRRSFLWGLGAVWLDGFSELTPQELELLTEVITISREATLAFCLPDFPKGDPSWVSAWSGVTGTFRSVWNRVGGIAGSTIEVVELPEAGQATRFTDSEVIGHLAEHWVGGGGEVKALDSADGGSVRCVACADPVAEATRVARAIVRYVRDEPGRRYRDVGVMLRSFEGYHDVICRVFRRYGIPFFLDRREPVAHHPLAELIRYGLRTVAFGWQHEDWFGALKTGLVPAGEAALDELENEALAHGWAGGDWHRPIQLPGDPVLERRLERTRRQVLPAFELLAKRLDAPGGIDGKELAAALSRLWSDLGVEDRLGRWALKGAEEPGAERFGSVHGTVWELMQGWLQNLELAFTGREDLVSWLPVLESGLSGLTVGVIPPALDQVLVGTIDRSRNPDLQMAVVMGLNEGVFPAVPRVSGLLTGHDRDQLEREGVLFRGNTRSQLSRERYLGYIAMTRARARLLLTYAERDGAGRVMNPSPFLRRVEQLIPGLELESGSEGEGWAASEHAVELLSPAIRMRDRAASAVLGPLLAGSPWAERVAALMAPEQELSLSPAVADALYGPVLRTSVSALEHFAACPFRFFVLHGLRAVERRQYEVDAREQGSFQHEVLSRFHEQLRSEGLRWREVSSMEARERVGTIAAEVTSAFREGLFEASTEREAEARRLTRLLQEFVAVAVEWMRQCAFDPVVVEVGFGRTADPLPAWEIALDEKHRLAFRGKIDRVDLVRVEGVDEAYCMVVDYKSGSRVVDAVLMEHGVQIQLPAYLVGLREMRDLDAVLGVRRIRPVGMFYVPLRGQVEGGGNRREVLQREEAERRRVYRHVGRFDAAHLRLFDTRADAMSGEQFNYRLTAAGLIHARCQEPMASGDFEGMLDGVAASIREMGRRIFAGEMGVDPYRHKNTTACEGCLARGICRIDPWRHRFRLLKRKQETGKAGE